MSYTAPTARTTGDLVTASIWNTDIVNNILAIFGGAMGLSSQAAQDLIYAVSASQLGRLAVGAVNGLLLQVVGGVLGWSSVLTGFIEGIQPLTIVANVLSFDYRLGNVVTLTLNASIVSMFLSNVPISGQYGIATIIVTYDGSASTWAWLTSTVKWQQNAPPTLTLTNGKVDVFVVFTTDGGTTWRGIVVGQNW